MARIPTTKGETNMTKPDAEVVALTIEDNLKMAKACQNVCMIVRDIVYSKNIKDSIAERAMFAELLHHCISALAEVGFCAYNIATQKAMAEEQS